MALFTDIPGGTACHVRVTPRAGRTAIAGTRDGTLLVRLAAAPVDGAANDALVELLARALDRPRRDIALVSGERSRTKRIRIDGMSAAAAERRLAAALDEPSKRG